MHLNCTVTGWRCRHHPADGSLMWAELPAAPRCSNRLPMPRNKSQGGSTAPEPYVSRGNNVPKGGVLSKESASYIEKMVGRETKPEKKKKQNKTEDGIVRRLAKNGFIDKDKVRAMSSRRNLRRRTRTRTRTRKARPPLLTLIPPPTQILTLIP